MWLSLLDIVRHAIGMCPDASTHPNLLTLIITFGGIAPLGWWRLRLARRIKK